MKSKTKERFVRFLDEDNRDNIGLIWKRRYIIKDHTIHSVQARCLLKRFEAIDAKDRKILLDVIEEYFGDPTRSYKSLNVWQNAIRHAFIVATGTGDGEIAKRLEDLSLNISNLKPTAHAD